jgi:hypothetical protein
MAKKDFSMGLQNLLGGADKSVTQQQPKPNTGMIEAALDRLPDGDTEEAAPRMDKEPTTFEDETDLINTIEDPELREALQKRLQQKRMVGRGRPRKTTDKNGKRTDGYDRTSLIISVEKWAKIKEIAFRETLTMKEIVELALDLVIERYEAKHGEVKPQSRKRDINEIF